MKKEKFGGAAEKRTSLFGPLEKKFVDKFTPFVPKFLETYHLTYMTVLWSALIILFSFFAGSDINWLWLVSLMIFLQYISDLFDGSVGRYRNTGLIKWGFYMDHFLDYIFLSAILIGYSLILPVGFDYSILIILVIFGSFMVNSYLSFAATNKFEIDFLMIGPTEIRFIFIIINTLIILFGKTYMAVALPYVLGFSFLGLVVIVYKTQRKIWKIDEANKGENI
ncbi:CDP-alcohol phosphatidyltransferase family protein [Thermoproteota archaeon]